MIIWRPCLLDDSTKWNHTELNLGFEETFHYHSLVWIFFAGMYPANILSLCIYILCAGSPIKLSCTKFGQICPLKQPIIPEWFPFLLFLGNLHNLWQKSPFSVRGYFLPDVRSHASIFLAACWNSVMFKLKRIYNYTATNIFRRI